MGQGVVAVAMTSDMGKYLADLERAARANSAVAAEQKKIATAAKEAAKEEDNLTRAAKAVFEETRQPLERYTAQFEKLKGLLKAGAIDQETFSRTTRQAREELDRASRSGQGAFGEQMFGNIKNLAMALTGVHLGLSMVSEGMEKIAAQKREAAASASGAEMDEGALAELSKGDKEIGRALLAQSRATAARAGMSRQQAAKLTFATTSAEMSPKDAEIFTELYRAGIVRDPEVLAKSAQTMQSSMGGKDKVGSIRDIVSMGFAAGEFAPTHSSELMPAASKAGGYALAADISPAEVLAATAIAAKASGSGEVGGTRVKALVRALGRMGAGQVTGDEEGGAVDAETMELRERLKPKLLGLKMGGKSLVQRLEYIQGLGLNEAELQKLFGRQEGIQGYRDIMGNRASYDKAKERIGGASGEDLVGKILDVNAGDEQLGGARQARVQKAKLEEKGAGLWANEKLLAGAVVDHYNEKLRDGSVLSEVREFIQTTNRKLQTNRQVIRQQYDAGMLDDDPELKSQAGRFLGLEKAADNLQKAATETRRGNPTLARPDDDR